MRAAWTLWAIWGLWILVACAIAVGRENSVRIDRPRVSETLGETLEALGDDAKAVFTAEPEAKLIEQLSKDHAKIRQAEEAARIAEAEAEAEDEDDETEAAAPTP